GGEGILGRSPTPEDVEPLTWALYEKGRALDALSYRRTFANSNGSRARSGAPQWLTTCCSPRL
ncbi:MAG TPA: hypothetical protein VIZ60_08115, partial [Rubrobacter sp.]